jgi:DNA-binding GntR family transcriptional regulator
MRSTVDRFAMPPVTASPTALSTIERRSLPEAIASELRRAIFAGELTGRALPEARLATQMGVSRAPVREAMLQLEREGLIEFDPNGRTRVRALSAKDYDEIVTTRIALESMAASLAAAQWTPEDTAAVEGNLAAQRRAATLADLSRLDVEMHEYILRRSGNSRLLALWRCIQPQFEMWLAHTHRLQATLTHKPRQLTVDSHERLLRAIASRNPEKAANAMSTHIESWREWLPAHFPPREVRTKSARI